MLDSKPATTPVQIIDSRANPVAEPDTSYIEEGKIVALQHCKSCHLLPDPSLLDKENWQAALAMMANQILS